MSELEYLNSSLIYSLAVLPEIWHSFGRVSNPFRLHSMLVRQGSKSTIPRTLPEQPLRTLASMATQSADDTIYQDNRYSYPINDGADNDAKILC